MSTATEDLDWGGITPDLWSAQAREAVHVLNVAVGTPAQRDRVARFAAGVAVQFTRNLPPGSTQRVHLDVRGQAITSADLSELHAAILSRLPPALRPGITIEHRI